MLPEDKYFKMLSEEELWQRYCGFLDLSIGEFMEIQQRLLMEEIELVSDTLLGKKIMNGNKPRSVEEFRRTVPLTTYQDYEPYFSEKREDILAGETEIWCHSSGRSGKFKWIPWSVSEYEAYMKYIVAFCILSATGEKGKVNFRPGARVLLNIAPAPYTFGAVIDSLPKYLSLQLFPSMDEAEEMDFQERIEKGFYEAFRDGADIIFSLSSIMAKVGEGFVDQQQKMKFSPSVLLKPKFLFRLLRALIVSKKEGRPILPRDLCQPKAAVTAGTDTSIYRDKIAYYWGREPYEFYGGTDGGLVAMQSWNKRGMTFTPDGAFLEFVSEKEIQRWEDDKDYQPSTLLLDELEAGKTYELVVTRLHGNPLLRYRVGDVLKIAALRDEETGINLPQMVFHHRAGETIGLAGLAQLDESTIWRALTNTGLKYEEWSACKEYDGNKTFLRLYLELKRDEETEVAEIERVVDEQLKVVDLDYRDVNSHLGLQPVKGTLLSSGTFQRYYEEKRKEGVDLSHLKPSHVNAPEAVIRRLCELSRAI